MLWGVTSNPGQSERVHQTVAIELGLEGCVGVHQGRNGEEITADRGTDGAKVRRDKSPP